VPDEQRELLEYRVQQLELVEKALRVELHDLRVERDARLREDYMTRDELLNTFVPRKELDRRGRVRREWLPIALTLFFGGLAAANIVIQIVQGR
jgi:hypothetical protein